MSLDLLILVVGIDDDDTIASPFGRFRFFCSVHYKFLSSSITSKLTMKSLSSIYIFFLMIAGVSAFGVGSAGNNNNCGGSTSLDRNEFLAILTGAGTSVALGLPSAAFAKDESAKGTKADPEFEACLSKCLYFCTKPKGEEQKSRKECLPECRKECSKTKAQMMTGVPKSSD